MSENPRATAGEHGPPPLRPDPEYRLEAGNGALGTHGGMRSRLQRLLRAREILLNFWLQDLKTKYRRSVLGFGWALLQPLLMLSVITAAFYFLFSGQPRTYVLHLLANLLPWICFAQSLEGAARSITTSAGFLRVYPFPRLLFPLRRVLASFTEFLLALGPLFLLATLIGFRPSPALIVLPLSVALLFLFSLGLGALFAVASVYFRDMEHILGVVIRAWFYLSPIIVPLDRLPASYRPVLALNPMVHFLELFDAPLSRATWPAPLSLAIATGLAFGTLALGLAVFWRKEEELIFKL